MNDYTYMQRCVYNEDNTQVLFDKEDGEYISSNGGEGVKVFDNNFGTIVLPKYDKQMTNFTGQNAFIAMSYLPYKNLSNFAYIDTDGKMIYLNSELKGNYFAENAQSSRTTDLNRRCYLSENGNSVLYIDNQNNLCKAETNKPIGNAKVLIKSVAKFTASEDNQLIYALTQKNELYCVKDDSEPIKIADKLNSEIVMSNDNKTAFYTVGVNQNTAGGTLYASDNGGEGKVIQTSGGVIGLVATPANVFFYNYDYIDGKTQISIYKSNGNINFIKFSQ